MPSEIVRTIKPAEDGGYYSTLSGFVAGEQRDLTAADEIAVAECYAFPGDLRDQVVFNGFTSDETRYPVVRAALGHEAMPDGAGFFIYWDVWNASTFRVNDNYVRLENIGIRFDHPTHSRGVALSLYDHYAQYVQITGCVIDDRGAYPGSINRKAASIVAQNLTFTDTYIFGSMSGNDFGVMGPVNFEHCTIDSINRNDTFLLCNRSSNVLFADNTVVLGGTGFSVGGNAVSGDFNASTDTSAPGANSLHNIVPANEFVSPGNPDYDYELLPASSLLGAASDGSAIGAYQPIVTGPRLFVMALPA